MKNSGLFITAALAAGLIATGALAQDVRDIGTPTNSDGSSRVSGAAISATAESSRDTGLPAGWEGLSRLSEADTDTVAGEGWFSFVWGVWACCAINNTYLGKTIPPVAPRGSVPIVRRR